MLSFGILSYLFSMSRTTSTPSSVELHLGDLADADAAVGDLGPGEDAAGLVVLGGDGVGRVVEQPVEPGVARADEGDPDQGQDDERDQLLLGLEVIIGLQPPPGGASCRGRGRGRGRPGRTGRSAAAPGSRLPSCARGSSTAGRRRPAPPVTVPPVTPPSATEDRARADRRSLRASTTAVEHAPAQLARAWPARVPALLVELRRSSRSSDARRGWRPAAACGRRRTAGCRDVCSTICVGSAVGRALQLWQCVAAPRPASAQTRYGAEQVGRRCRG